MRRKGIVSDFEHKSVMMFKTDESENMKKDTLQYGR